MQLCLVTLGTFQKLVERLLSSIVDTLLRVLLEFCTDENTLKAPFLSRFQIKRHQAASPPATLGAQKAELGRALTCVWSGLSCSWGTGTQRLWSRIPRFIQPPSQAAMVHPPPCIQG